MPGCARRSRNEDECSCTRGRIRAELPGFGERGEGCREFGQVLEGLELRFAERVVVGHMRAAVGLGDAEVGEQECHRLGGQPLLRRVSIHTGALCRTRSSPSICLLAEADLEAAGRADRPARRLAQFRQWGLRRGGSVAVRPGRRPRQQGRRRPGSPVHADGMERLHRRSPEREWALRVPDLVRPSPAESRRESPD